MKVMALVAVAALVAGSQAAQIQLEFSGYITEMGRDFPTMSYPIPNLLGHAYTAILSYDSDIPPKAPTTSHFIPGSVLDLKIEGYVLPGTAPLSAEWITVRDHGLAWFGGNFLFMAHVELESDFPFQPPSLPAEKITITGGRLTVSEPGLYWGIGVITSVEVVPAISISDVKVPEGNSESRSAVLVATLSNPSSQPVTVNWSTFDGTGLAGADYIPKAGSLLFPPGVTSQSVTNNVLGDLLDEPDETFVVSLSAPVNATIAKTSGVITVTDDDPPPTVTINSVTIIEGDAGSAEAVFAVQLEGKSALPVAVDYETKDLTAVAPQDYLYTSGTLEFVPFGQNSAASTPSHSVPELQIARSNSAPVLWWAAGDLVGLEETDSLAGSGWRASPLQPSRDVFQISIEAPLTERARFYRLVSLAPGSSSVGCNIHVPIIGDRLSEPVESFSVRLSNPIGVTILNKEGTGTITDNDQSAAVPPAIRLTSPADGDVFPADSSIIISAAITEGSNPIAKTEFFADGHTLGSAAVAPYQVSWADAPLGIHQLKAVVTDRASQTAESFTITIEVIVPDSRRKVALVQSFADLEISTLETWLTDLGLSVKIFDQEGLTFQMLQPYELVIWDDLGASDITAAEVEIFSRLKESIPLYLIGNKLAGSANALPTETASTWTALSHLQLAGVRPAGDAISIEGELHPANNGPFGLVGTFKLRQTLEDVRATGTGEAVILNAVETPAVLAFEDPGSSVRIVTQNFLAFNMGGVNATVQREKLFKNAVWWLLHMPGIPPFMNVRVEVQDAPAELKVGQEAALTVRIHHTGEIPATGVIVTMALPPNLSLVRADAPNGNCILEDQYVICFLPSLERVESARAAIVVRANELGPVVIKTTLSENQAEAILEDNYFQTTFQIVK